MTDATDERPVTADDELLLVEQYRPPVGANVLELPAGETVALEQGGDHLMLFNPDAALTSAESAEFTLTFEKAGEVTVTIPVKKASGHAH